MSSERIRDYFVEDVQHNTWTGKWRLITQAGYQEHGLVVEVTDEGFTFEEVDKLTELFHRNNVKSPLWKVQLDAAQ